LAQLANARAARRNRASVWRECARRDATLVALDRRLDLVDRFLDLVLGQVALAALAVGERQRRVELGRELAERQRFGDRRQRLVGRLRTPAHDDAERFVAVAAGAALGSRIISGPP
jgi:hypothetical protein